MLALVVWYLGIKIQTRALTYFQNGLKSFVHELFIQEEPNYHGNFLPMGIDWRESHENVFEWVSGFFQLLGFKFFFTPITLAFLFWFFILQSFVCSITFAFIFSWLLMVFKMFLFCFFFSLKHSALNCLLLIFIIFGFWLMFSNLDNNHASRNVIVCYSHGYKVLCLHCVTWR